MNSIEFDEELLRLKEREAGSAGRNKVKIKKSLNSNIVIQGPTLQLPIHAPSSIVDLLIMNEEADMTAGNDTIPKKDTTRNSNMYSVLDEEDTKPTIVIQPSILKLGLGPPLHGDDDNNKDNDDDDDVSI